VVLLSDLHESSVDERGLFVREVRDVLQVSVGLRFLELSLARGKDALVELVLLRGGALLSLLVLHALEPRLELGDLGLCGASGFLPVAMCVATSRQKPTGSSLLLASRAMAEVKRAGVAALDLAQLLAEQVHLGRYGGLLGEHLLLRALELALSALGLGARVVRLLADVLGGLQLSLQQLASG
jgi:hypothetical protein